MNRKIILAWILFGGMLPAPLYCLDQFSFIGGGISSPGISSAEDSLYNNATKALNENRWKDAEELFSRVIQKHGARAEGALYWKAYAENKGGQSNVALKTCQQLRSSYPKSHWLEECSALEIEIRGRGGIPVMPQAEQNEDLKLLALNSLMMKDEDHALPSLEKILSQPGSEKLKERALFVLAQSNSPKSQALMSQIIKDQDNPALQLKAIRMFAAMKGKQSADSLAEIYHSTSNEKVKEGILQSYIISRSPDKLLEAARKETNPNLTRQAVNALGALGSVSDLATLYQSTNQTEMKSKILNAFVASGKRGFEPLSNIARTEQDRTLRIKAIRNLGLMGRENAVPVLVATYQKSADKETKKAAAEGLFLAQDSHDLIALAKEEKDPEAKQVLVRYLSLINNKEASDYMMELLEK